jgi:hypothetical protein
MPIHLQVIKKQASSWLSWWRTSCVCLLLINRGQGAAAVQDRFLRKPSFALLMMMMMVLLLLLPHPLQVCDYVLPLLL